MTVTEAALLERVGSGDRGEPLVDLYGRYGGRLYGLGLRLLGDPGMAEELVQDTFVRLWTAAPRFDPRKGSVRTFVYTIARRAAVDLQRRAASRPLPTSAEAGDSPESAAHRAEEPFDDLVMSIEVREAVSALSPKHREVLELHYDRDLSQPEIAERLAVPLGTVKTRAHYALKALKLELEERELIG